MLLPRAPNTKTKKVRNWGVFRGLNTFLEGVWSPRDIFFNIVDIISPGNYKGDFQGLFVLEFSMFVVGSSKVFPEFDAFWKPRYRYL